MLLFLNVCEQIFHISTCAYQEVNVNIALNIYGSVVYGSFIYYVRKIFRKTNISYPLIRTRTCEYQGVRNVSFSENFAYLLNGWTLRNLIAVAFYCWFWKTVSLNIDVYWLIYSIITWGHLPFQIVGRFFMLYLSLRISGGGKRLKTAKLVSFSFPAISDSSETWKWLG